MDIMMDMRKAMTASAFYLVAENAFDIWSKEVAENLIRGEKHLEANDTLQCFIPGMVNMAFSCELFLKSMQNSVRTHRIDNLYNGLEESIRIEIKRRTMEILMQSGSQYTEDKFDESLENIASVFSEWRYFFENQITNGFTNLEFLKAFSKALYTWYKECVRTGEIAEEK